jgi:uncharacterized protein YecA (UPF0149 family)
MSVEQKIKDLLARSEAKQIDEAEEMGAASVKKDTTVKTANAGDASAPKQGSSKDASFETREEDDDNQGAITAKGIKTNSLTANGPGATPNYTTVGDSASVVGQGSSKGNVAREEVEVEDEEVVEEDQQLDVKAELAAIFGDELSEDFRTKATSIFEAAVIARVNSEMDKISEQLKEQNAAEFEQVKEGLVEKIDSFLNYVVEQWMQENEVAIENGLRTEIAEDFMSGLKNLFKEHYIEVPEEKYDVLNDLQSAADGLEEKLNQTLEQNMDLLEQINALKKKNILGEMTADLADTEGEKLSKLLEGISFESEELFKEKVKVVKENYFPKVTKTPSDDAMLTEEAPIAPATETIARYAQALSRSSKTR